MKNKEFIKVITIGFIVAIIGGCIPIHKSSEIDDKDKVEENQNLINKTQPIPQIAYSTVRQTKLDYMKISNTSRIPTNTYMYCNQKLAGIFSTFGFPVNTSIQVTNPNAVKHHIGIGYHLSNQAEPDSMYYPEGYDTASIITLALPNGDTTPLVSECNLTSTAAPMYLDKQGVLRLKTEELNNMDRRAINSLNKVNKVNLLNK